MIKIGLLPLYIELYDSISPELRSRLEAFYERMAQKLENENFVVLRSPFCRIRDEFTAAVAAFEKEEASCIVTLHMAYSPSLESAEILAKTNLPIIVLDTTETYDFGPSQSPDEISYCHGIHGVMDMCSLLRRNGKDFAIAAGHPEESPVISRVCGFVRAAHAAKMLSGFKTGLIGGAFDGMGDFAVTAEEMRERFGVEIVTPEPATLTELQSAVTSEEIAAEIGEDYINFTPLGEILPELHQNSTRTGLALRSFAKRERLQALSVNFQNIGSSGLSTMPFMELCKMMASGFGYAGEGDVLTASFTGALMQSYEDVSFIEIFCPDWKGNTLFLSHMGEMNIRLAKGPLEMGEKEFKFGNAKNPIACYGCYKEGQAIFANIFRTPEDFGLVLAPVIMAAPSGSDAFTGNIRGWMRHDKPVSEFLETLSLAGATHHSILIYGAEVEQLRFFGELLKLKTVLI